ncbi:MAG: alkaline phosphatase family protein [Dehalococcoidia bacterium]
MTNENARPRTVLIGLDALDLSLFEHLLETGALPNLARFARETQRAVVRSDGETFHGSIWPTFATGRGPGHHGMYFWTQWHEEEMGYVRNSHPSLRMEPFWHEIGASGVPLTMVDAPYMPLARQPDSLEISAWGVHDEMEPSAWPDGWWSTFIKRFGRNPLSFDTVEPQSRQDKLKMVSDMRRGVALRAKAARELLRERQGPGFFLLVFCESHKAGHYLAAPEKLGDTLTNVTAFARILEPLDAAWPEIVEAAGPNANIFLFSLHGTVHQVDYSASLGSQVMALSLGKEASAAVVRPDLLRRARNLLPASVHRAIWRRLPARFRASRQGVLSSAGVDIEHDPIFRVPHDGHVALRGNLQGRERDGKFAQAEIDEALAKVESLAAAFKTEDGRAAFPELVRSRERFPGPRSHRLPDGLLLSNPAVTGAERIIGPDDLVLTNTEPEARNGIHNGRGFLFARTAEGSGLSLARTEIDTRDFAPSMLALFGLSGDDGLPGESFLA